MISNRIGAIAVFGLAFFILTWIDQLPWPWSFRRDEPTTHKIWRSISDAASSTLLVFGSLLVGEIARTWVTDPVEQRIGNIVIAGALVITLVFFVSSYLTTAGNIIRPRLRPDDDLFAALDDG